MAARYGHLINKWTVAAVAALAVMAALLAAALPVWAQQADRPPTVANPTTLFDDYKEGSTNPVVTYTAHDPDRDLNGNRYPIFWTLAGPDAEDFTITPGGSLNERGTLRFKSPPDYEAPRTGRMTKTVMALLLQQLIQARRRLYLEKARATTATG